MSNELMQVTLLKALLEVQTVSGKEDKMVDFIIQHCLEHGYTVSSDESKNVYITKGVADWYPACLLYTSPSPRD